jgi:hypothetical protein
MDVLLKRDNAFALFRNINAAVLNTYVRLKNQYTEQSPPTNEIINSFKVRLALVDLEAAYGGGHRPRNPQNSQSLKPARRIEPDDGDNKDHRKLQGGAVVYRKFTFTK